MNDEKVEWINGKWQIEGASEASLKRSLLTCDGAGVEIKKMCLEELLKRAIFTYKNGIDYPV